MEKKIYFGLLLLPFIFIFTLPKVNKFKKILFLIILIGLQTFIYLSQKNPNCYETNCKEIENNKERTLFYEKYNTLNDDLNTLRSEEYQQSHIFKSFNHQLMIMLILFPLCHAEEYEKTMNWLLYVMLTVFSFESSLLLSNELYKFPNINLTYFEIIDILRIIEIGILLILREIISYFTLSNVKLLEKQLKVQKQNINKQQIENIQNIISQLQIKPKQNLFSSENTYKIIAFVGLIQLITQ